MAGSPLTVSELLNQVEMSRANFDALVATFPREQLEAPGSTGWSVKDHLAHLSAWHMSLLALLNGGDRDQAMGFEPGAHSKLSTDGLNDLIFKRSREASLESVLAEYERNHQLVRERIGAMTDEDLQRPYSHYQPNDPPYNEQPVIGWILGNTVEHDEEHVGWLRDLKKDLGEGGEA